MTFILRYQLDLEGLKADIYNSQSRKISKMPIWEAIELYMEISKSDFIDRWGDSISLKDELEIQQQFGHGFSVYVNHDKNFYTAEKVYASLNPAFSFIIEPQDGEEYSLDLEVVVILDKTYLKPYHCTKTPNCLYKVYLSYI